MAVSYPRSTSSSLSSCSLLKIVMFGYSISGQTQISYWSYEIYIYIWVNYNDLTATSLESWLAREIIPKWTLFRLVKYYNLSRYIVNIPLQLDPSIDHCISGNQNLPPSCGMAIWVDGIFSPRPSNHAAMAMKDLPKKVGAVFDQPLWIWILNFTQELTTIN